jgi:hypothetical protein
MEVREPVVEEVVVVDAVDVVATGGVEPPHPASTVVSTAPTIAVRRAARRPSGRTMR